MGTENQNNKVYRVLVAEDSAIQAEMLRRKLVEGGYMVTVVRDGEEAMASFLSAPPDIAILDIIMPKMSGIEVCQQIKDNHLLRHIPVVLATALEEQDAKLAGIEAGADEFLNKPFDLND